MSIKSEKLGQKIAGSMADIMGANRPKLLMHAPQDDNTIDMNTGRRQNLNQSEVPVALVMPDPTQPRKVFEEGAIRELAESIQAKGQLQNIGVWWSEADKKWVIIYGERRWRAIQSLGHTTINANCWSEKPSDADILEMQIVENDQRANLRPVELARAYFALKEKTGGTIDQMAMFLKKGKGTISKALALLKLPPDLQARVDAEENPFPAITAYEIVSSTEDPEQQRALFSAVTEQKLTREQLAHLIHEQTGGKRGRSKNEATADPTPASGKGLRVAYRLQGGGSVTVAGIAEEPSYDEMLGLLDSLAKKIKTAKLNNVPISELQAFLKAPPEVKKAKKATKQTD